MKPIKKKAIKEASPYSCKRNWWDILENYFLPYLLPLIIIAACSPVLFHWRNTSNKEAEATFVIVIAISFWLTKCIPPPATSFIPIFAVPLLGIADSDVIVSAYMNEAILYCFGIYTIGVAIEYSNLHTRIALHILRRMSSNISRLLIGLMCTTALLSMFITNTLCAQMMTPILIEILHELEMGAVLNPDGKLFPKSLLTLYLPRNESEFLVSTNAFGGSVASGASFPCPFPGDIDTIDYIPPVKKLVKKSKSELPSLMGDSSKPSENDTATKTSKKSKDPSSSFTWTSETEQNGDYEINEQPQGMGNFYSEDQAEHNIDRIYSIRSMFLLATAYAVNVGGTAVLTGTSTNIVALYVMEAKRSEIEANPSSVKNPSKCLQILTLNSVKWFKFNTATTWLNIVLGFLFFKGFFLCCHNRKMKKSLPTMKQALGGKLSALGPISFHEIAVSVLLVVWILLMLSENPYKGFGWGPLLQFSEDDQGMARGSVLTFFIILLLFLVPRKSVYFRRFRGGGLGKGLQDPLLNWPYLQLRIPWHTLLALGAGHALIVVFYSSGLGGVIGRGLLHSGIRSAPTFTILLSVSVTTALITSFISNITTCLLVVPLVLELAFASGAHPLYFVLPATTVCSYAFLFTKSTAPNAIFASINSVKQIDVFKSGSCLLLISLSALLLATHTLGELIFDFSHYPGYCDLT